MKLKKRTTALLLRKCVAMLLLLWCAAPAVLAQDAPEYLVVHLNSGQQISYVLADKPVVTYSGPQVHVESALVSDDHNLADVEKLTFVKKTDISDVPAADETRITVTPGAVTLQGLPEGCTVTLADLQGRLLLSVTADTAGEAVLATGSYPAGVYIVATAHGHAFKIYVK